MKRKTKWLGGLMALVLLFTITALPVNAAISDFEATAGNGHAVADATITLGQTTYPVKIFDLTTIINDIRHTIPTYQGEMDFPFLIKVDPVSGTTLDTLPVPAPIGQGGQVDLSGHDLSDGLYMLEIRSNRPAGSIGGPDTGDFILNILTVEATADVGGGPNAADRSINPTAMAIGSNRENYENPSNNYESGAKNTWYIADENGNPIQGLDSTTFGPDPSAVLEKDGNEYKHLPEGNYRLVNTATVETMFGNPVEDTAYAPFSIRYPRCNTAVDKPLNPTHIEGSQTIPDSTLGWAIYNSGGICVASGAGATVPPEEFSNLPEGTYRVEFTETSPEGLSHLSSGNFQIQPPPPPPPANTSSSVSGSTPAVSGALSASTPGGAPVVGGNSGGSSAGAAASGATSTNSPRTGDNGILWYGLFFGAVGLGGAALLVVYRIRRRKRGEQP